MKYSTFETDVAIRPDDIDMNNHVHNSKYLDLVLAARYDQMTRCYKMSMDEFIAMGLGLGGEVVFYRVQALACAR